MKRTITIACAALLAPVLAWAQPKTAEEWYKEGETRYNLGDFTGAVEAFKKGFELEPHENKKSAYLHNIAQSYRQANDCSNAQFFYKRYLALKDADTVKPLKPEKRAEYETIINDLEACKKQQDKLRERPPDSTIKPEADPKREPDTRTATRPEDDTEPEDDDTGAVVKKRTQVGQPRLIMLRAAAGGAKITTGDLPIPVQFTAALNGGYPLAINPQLTVDVGLGLTITPVPFVNMVADKNGRALFTGALANAGATYQVTPQMGLRGDVGLGILVFSGVSESPFTNNAPTDGALTMFHFRVGAAFEYAITPNVVAAINPAFSYSPPKNGLRDDITSITAFDFMAGIGYRM